MNELTIDKEFAALCPGLTPEEFNLLEASLESDGCRDPIIVWANHNDTILDGHNRYKSCRRFQIPFKTKALSFASREDARNWIINNQLGRRNLTEEQKKYLRGKRYRAEKQEHGGDRKSSGQRDHLKTADRLADEYGVSAKTIRRDEKYAEAVDTIETSAGKQAKDAILNGQLKASGKDISKLAMLPSGQQAEAINGGAKGVKGAVKRKPKQKRKPIDDGIDLRDYVDRQTGSMGGALENLKAVPPDGWNIFIAEYQWYFDELRKACDSYAEFLAVVETAAAEREDDPLVRCCADGRWRTGDEIAKATGLKPRQVSARLGRLKSGKNPSVFCEVRPAGADGKSYRLVKAGGRKVDLLTLRTEIAPLIDRLQAEGKKHIARYSPGTASNVAHELKKLLEKLAT